jgi:hypothetical protein
MSDKKKQTRTEYNVSPEEFIRVWQTAASADEVAEKLKMPKPIVHARATTYRKAGIKLKSMPRTGRASLDVEALNRLVDELAAAPPHGATHRPKS